MTKIRYQKIENKSKELGRQKTVKTKFRKLIVDEKVSKWTLQDECKTEEKKKVMNKEGIKEI